MSVVFRESLDPPLIRNVDVGLLSSADRASLRLLYRAGVASADQLATLVYPSRRSAYRHLRRLWQLGLVERAPLAPVRGGIPVAYRLTRRGSKRLGYVDTRTGGVGRVRHSLDIVDAVCALVRSAPGSVQLWRTESMVDEVMPETLNPDSVVVVQLGDRSAAICLEVDEATEHAPVLRPRLDAYAAALGSWRGWHLLWTVPSRERLVWLRQVAGWDRRPDLAGRCWIVVLDELRVDGYETPTFPMGWSGRSRPLREIVSDRAQRRCPTPVGAAAWVRLLASGGVEDGDAALDLEDDESSQETEE
jgi:hypothetical protein